jgi:hypothetical protein
MFKREVTNANSTQYFWNQNISHYNKTDATDTKYANGGKA